MEELITYLDELLKIFGYQKVLRNKDVVYIKKGNGSINNNNVIRVQNIVGKRLILLFENIAVLNKKKSELQEIKDCIDKKMDSDSIFIEYFDNDFYYDEIELKEKGNYTFIKQRSISKIIPISKENVEMIVQKQNIFTEHCSRVLSCFNS